MDVTQRIVANAAKYFREGNYQEALSLYQQAAKLYDSRFFLALILRCANSALTVSSKMSQYFQAHLLNRDS